MPRRETHCVFCFNPVEALNKRGRTGKNVTRGSGKDFRTDLLENEVNAVFIVRKLLLIPDQKCEQLLGMFGNPSGWFATCEKCSELVNEARKIHERICILERKLDSSRNDIKRKISASRGLENVSGKAKTSFQIFDNNSAVGTIRNCVLLNGGDFSSPESKTSSSDVLNAYVYVKEEPVEDADIHDGNLETHSVETASTTDEEPQEQSSVLRSRKTRTRIIKMKCKTLTRTKIGCFKCTHCTSNFKQRADLMRHMRHTHWILKYQSTKNKNLVRNRKCRLCLEEFNHIDTFKKHCIDEHSMIPCSECPRLFPSYLSLRSHKAIVHEVKRVDELKIDQASLNVTSKVGDTEMYKCLHCSFRGLSKGQLHRHLRTMHWQLYQTKNDMSNSDKDPTQKVLQCDRCLLSGAGVQPKQLFSLEGLRSHKISVHKMVKCEKCSKVFLGMGYLVRHHMTFHNAETVDPSTCRAEKTKTVAKPMEKKVPICKYCKATFETKAQLSAHHFDSHPDEMFKCDKCPEKFDLLANLFYHKTVVHNEPDNPYKCPLCDFSKKHVTHHRYQNIHTHRMIVHKERARLVCELCSDSFASERYLKFHKIKKHGLQADVSLQCTHCNKIFATPFYLNVHIQTVHFGQWRYKCPHCNQGFRCQGQVDDHVNVVHKHKNNLTLECPESGCHKKFAIRSQLLTHIKRVHAPKNFKCSYCDFASGDRNQTKIHTEIHTNNGSFQCDHCGKSFGVHRYLQQHLRMTHKIKVERGNRGSSK